MPNLPYAMYTVAMDKMVVTSTGFQDKDGKKALQTMVELMGGLYSNSFHEGVTHLVAKVSGIYISPGQYLIWRV